ncbi:MAG: LAGLIDADG family homing endonuclease [Candidatus Cloacimonetes bacterium]|nr:LAGLIDADG family homing endonuclease [Candidatus Cloacimonadota bacterium]
MQRRTTPSKSEKNFHDNIDEILDYLELGNSKNNVIKKYHIGKTILNRKLQELGLLEKYSDRSHTISFVNFQKYKNKIVEMRRNGCNVREISEKCNVRLMTLRKELKKIDEYQIDRKKLAMYQTEGVKRFNKYKSKIIQGFKEGKSINSLSRKFEISPNTINRRLVEYGLYRREKRMVHQFNETFFENIDNNTKSYWLGWMYSDGFVQIHTITKGKYIGLDLSGIDVDIVTEFRNSIQSNMRVKEVVHKPKSNTGFKNKDYKSYRLIFLNEKMFDDLGKLGGIPKKSLILKFPTSKQVPNKYIRPFLLGYLEGDGAIIFTKRKKSKSFRITFTIIGTKHFCQGYKMELQNILKNYSIKSTITIRQEKRRKNNTYNLVITKTSSVLVICDVLFNSFESIMYRKSEKFYKYCKWYYQNRILESIGYSPLKNKELCDEIVLRNKHRWEQQECKY